MPNKEVKISDVSHWRWPTPVSAIKAAGFSALIAKATEGTSWIDDRYDDFQAAAAEESLPFGSFHYWRAAYDPVKQAKHYFDIAKTVLLQVSPEGADSALCGHIRNQAQVELRFCPRR